ncbi:hypothetical protein PQX77_019998 [Marasmius sp. AFHP31]|nr:hypothetical protein PQX77_019998 [Marasmius sp. AFHP31]
MTSVSQDFAFDEPQPGGTMPPAATAWTNPYMNNPGACVGDMQEVPSRSRHCKLQIGDRNDPTYDHNTFRAAAPYSDFPTTDLMIATNELQAQSAVGCPRDDSTGTGSLLSELAHGPGTQDSSSSAAPSSYGDQQRTHLFTDVSFNSHDGYSDSDGHDHGEPRLASSRQVLHGGFTPFAANLGFNNTARSSRQPVVGRDLLATSARYQGAVPGALPPSTTTIITSEHTKGRSHSSAQIVGAVSARAATSDDTEVKVESDVAGLQARWRFPLDMTALGPTRDSLSPNPRLVQNFPDSTPNHVNRNLSTVPSDVSIVY